MINKGSKRRYFFDSSRRLIRSKRSRVPKGSKERSETIRKALYCEEDEDFIDFVEVSSAPLFEFELPFLCFFYRRLICAEVSHNRPRAADDP